MKNYDSFDDWFEAQTLSNRRLIKRLRELVNEIAPRLTEGCKWTNGVWLKGDLPIIFIHAKEDHVQFGFFAGALLSDPKNLLQGKGKFVRHIKVSHVDDIDAPKFATMIRKAVKAPAYK